MLKATGEKLKVTVEKMAKSKMNGVNPDDVIRDYGADVHAPLRDVHGRVRAAQALGPARHRGREPLPQARLAPRSRSGTPRKAPAGDPHLRLRHKTIKRVTADLERMQFNTAIAAMMEYLNALGRRAAPRAKIVV